jgi:hypothetical protein
MSVQSHRRSIVASVAVVTIALASFASVGAAAGPNGAGNGDGAGPNGYRTGSRVNAGCPSGGQGAAPHQCIGNQATGPAGQMGRRNSVPAGTLTAGQRDMVGYMAEEEKLAHDLYVTLGSTVGGLELPRIAESEVRHLAAVRTLMTRYGITDPTAGLGVGVFSNEEFQAMYDSLLAQGRLSLAAAYDVGEVVERDDIDELGRATEGVTAPDLLRVYANLLRGSERHLAAFQAAQ